MCFQVYPHLMGCFLEEDILPTLIAILEGGIEMIRKGKYIVWWILLR